MRVAGKESEGEKEEEREREREVVGVVVPSQKVEERQREPRSSTNPRPPKRQELENWIDQLVIFRKRGSKSHQKGY